MQNLFYLNSYNTSYHDYVDLIHNVVLENMKSKICFEGGFSLTTIKGVKTPSILNHFNFSDCNKINDQILRNKLIIFSADIPNLLSRIFLHKLVIHLCLLSNYRNTVAYIENGDILLFPQIRYQDSYMIKQILCAKTNDSNIRIGFCGKEHFVFI